VRYYYFDSFLHFAFDFAIICCFRRCHFAAYTMLLLPFFIFAAFRHAAMLILRAIFRHFSLSRCCFAFAADAVTAAEFADAPICHFADFIIFRLRCHIATIERAREALPACCAALFTAMRGACAMFLLLLCSFRYTRRAWRERRAQAPLRDRCCHICLLRWRATAFVH